MTKEDLRKAINRCVNAYIEDYDVLGPDMQLCVYPETYEAILMSESDMFKEIAYANEALEAAAGAQGLESQESSDYQVKQNPDFYPMSTLVTYSDDGHLLPDRAAIDRLMSMYNDPIDSSVH
ncbi:MAG: hypothetical protein NC082_06370 [Clostridiales bacterium]|nr:hypothetical protein [Clostridiales bacterium]